MARTPVADPATDPPPGPPLLATDDAARELVSLALDANAPDYLIAARELAETLTIDQLARLSRAFRDAEQVVMLVRGRAINDALHRGAD